jgi:hypothetical protein
MDPHWFQFNADPGPALYLSADSEPGSQTNADPDSGQTWNILKADDRYKSLFDRQEVRFISVDFDQFLSILLDVDPDPHSQGPDLDPGQPINADPDPQHWFLQGALDGGGPDSFLTRKVGYST